MTATTIASIIEQSSASKGQAEFIADENLSLTGEELWQCIHSVAGNLKIRGLSKGDVLAFYCGSSVSQAVTFFACLVSGIIPCCLHVRETPERNRKNIDYIKAKKIISDPGLLVDAATLMSEDKIFSLTAEFVAKPPVEDLILPELNPDDPALILISSGTTGVPKCILHSQATLAATAKYGPYSYDCWSPKDSTIVVMDPSFAAWIHTVLPFIFINMYIYLIMKMKI